MNPQVMQKKPITPETFVHSAGVHIFLFAPSPPKKYMFLGWLDKEYDLLGRKKMGGKALKGEIFTVRGGKNIVSKEV